MEFDPRVICHLLANYGVSVNRSGSYSFGIDYSGHHGASVNCSSRAIDLGDMLDIDLAVIEHRLQVDPNHRRVKQKKRSFAMEPIKIIDEEVMKLVQAKFIMEVDYSEWLSNMVLVRKSNEKWRTRIDFTDLNKAFPKDSFPLPRIDQLVLADFTTERLSESSTKLDVWTLHVDGSSNTAGGGAGFILSSPNGSETLFALKLEFIATNNDVEYEALLAGLRLAEALRVAHIKAQEYAKAFVQFDIEHVPRAKNKKADALKKLASTTGSEWKDVIYLERIGKPSYEEDRINSVEFEISKDDWRASLFLYLQDGSLPEDNKEALKVRRKAARYTLIGRELYRRSLTLPYLRCLNNEEGKYVLRKIHEGVSGNHLASRALAHKAMRKFLLVAIDYFTKWVEVKPLATIIEWNITRFVWKSVVFHFEIPWVIVTGHGRQFDNEHFKKFYSDLSIKLFFTSMVHPQSNGQVENKNQMILHGLRTRLESMQGRWAEELPSLIWAYHTTKRAATGETPFMLVFGAEAVILAEVGIPSWRRQYFNEQTNNEELRSEIDFLEERQDQASLKVAVY
ncbi:uncharacterized protein LOC131166784 [Malania oleifera]|uniref:uncharacterized protein LOC131166784 n=1 Tax=Malania oleifera TaxID=397392 RepID=UPI0025ADA2F7|nr:uncharacterized protein LOC131166784 [Malania oleifera]